MLNIIASNFLLYTRTDMIARLTPLSYYTGGFEALQFETLLFDLVQHFREWNLATGNKLMALTQLKPGILEVLANTIWNTFSTNFGINPTFFLSTHGEVQCFFFSGSPSGSSHVANEGRGEDGRRLPAGLHGGWRPDGRLPWLPHGHHRCAYTYCVYI